MRFIAIVVALIISPSTLSQVVHLDCTATVTVVNDLYGTPFDEVGDTLGPYRFDINLENETAKIGGWSNDTYSSDPNDPSLKMSVGEQVIQFGKMPLFGGEMYMAIDREDLSFAMEQRYTAGVDAEGQCVLVETREPPKRAF